MDKTNGNDVMHLATGSLGDVVLFEAPDGEVRLDVRTGAGERAGVDSWQPGSECVRRTGLSDGGKQSSARAVFCHQEPSLCRLQQTHGFFFVRGLS